MYIGSTYTRARACTHKVRQEESAILLPHGEWNKCKWCTDLGGCLSFFMHKIQDAEGMQTECWNPWLFNLFNFMSNHYTSLTGVSFDSFIGSNTHRTSKRTQRCGKILKLALIAGPVKECPKFWVHSSQKWQLWKQFIQTLIALFTPSSQLNHFSLTCSFVDLPKCKISSEQRSKNVNNNNNNSSYNRLLKQQLKPTRDHLFKNVNNSKTKHKGSYWMHATTLNTSPPKEQCLALFVSNYPLGALNLLDIQLVSKQDVQFDVPLSCKKTGHTSIISLTTTENVCQQPFQWLRRDIGELKIYLW